MGVAVTSIPYPITEVHQDGPRGMWYRYIGRVASGGISAAGTVNVGPIDFPGELGYAQVMLRVSNGDGVSTGSANATFLTNTAFTVLGTYDEPSTTPTDRVWDPVRGDAGPGATGINMLLNAVSVVNNIIITTPMRSYLLKVSSTAAVSGGLRCEFLTLKSNG